MKRGERIARRYAKAMFLIGNERGEAPYLLEQLSTLVEATEEHDDLRRVLFTPIHARHRRRAVVRALCERLELSEDVTAFTSLLVEENRTPLLPAIRDALRALVERAAGRVEAQVTSARPLGEAEVERIRQALQERVGAEVSVQLDVDERLIGGVVARVGDLLLDGSVRTQLASLGGSLEEGSV